MAYTRLHGTTLQISFELLDRTIAVVLPSLAERQRWESVLEYALKHGSLPLPKAQPEARAQVRRHSYHRLGAAEQAGTFARMHASHTHSAAGCVSLLSLRMHGSLWMHCSAAAQSWHGIPQAAAVMADTAE